MWFNEINDMPSRQDEKLISALKNEFPVAVEFPIYWEYKSNYKRNK